MSELVLMNIDEVVLRYLQMQASSHGRTTEEEAKAILSEALGSRGQDGWEQVDAIHRSLTATGQKFSDSADLLREDRDR